MLPSNAWNGCTIARSMSMASINSTTTRMNGYSYCSSSMDTCRDVGQDGFDGLNIKKFQTLYFAHVKQYNAQQEVGLYRYMVRL
jgi:hypothetical protein